jgi:hypothetical protein
MLAPVEHIYNTLWCHIQEDGKLSWVTVEICKKYHFFMWINSLWQICVTRKNKMYLGLHVICSIFLLFVTKFGVCWQIFLKASNIKFHRNLFIWSCTDTYWLTDRWADRQGEANGLFCSCADVHKNRCIISLENTLGKINYFQALQLLSKEWTLVFI